MNGEVRAIARAWARRLWGTGGCQKAAQAGLDRLNRAPTAMWWQASRALLAPQPERSVVRSTAEGA
jgi:hypothetical protein